MLVLRKELKLGVGIGAAVLGIGGVYGLMAMLSSGNADHTAPAVAINSNDGDAKPAAKEDASTPADSTPKRKGFVDGLPPKDDKSDPFAESIRKDGNATPAWSTDAFSTGRINGDTKSETKNDAKATPAVLKVDTGAPDVTRAPGFTSKRSPAADSTKPEGVSVLPPSLVSTRTPTDGTKADAVKADSVKADSVKVSAGKSGLAAGGKYVIQSGDTFSTIADKIYGSKRYSAALVKANPDTNPSRLHIGHEINVPAKESLGGGTARGSIEAARPTLAAPIDASRQYRVAAGDTLSRIASKLYGKSAMWLAIYDANKAAIGPDSGRLKLGTVLELPQTPTQVASTISR